MPLKLPPPPVVPGVVFPGLDEFETRKDIGDEIKAACDTLAKSTVIPAYQEMFRRFKSVVDPTAVTDLTRLPYQSCGPNEYREKPTAIGCVYARLSWIIQMHWRGEDPREYIAELLRLAEIGLFKLKVVGDPRNGYWLEVPK